MRAFVLLLATAALTLSVASHANAGEWTPVEVDDKHMVLVETSQLVKQGATTYAWIASTFAGFQADSIYSVRARYAVRCEANMFRLQSITSYDINDAVIVTVEETTLTDAPWTPAIPETLGSNLVATVCNTSSLYPDIKPWTGSITALLKAYRESHP